MRTVQAAPVARCVSTSAATVDGRSSGVSPGSTSTSPSSSDRSSGKAVRPTRDGVAGAPLHALLDEVEQQVGRLVLELLGDPLGAVAHDDHDPATAQLGERVEDVEQHRPAAQQVERLGPGGAHAGALAGGEDTTADRGRAVMRPVLSATALGGEGSNLHSQFQRRVLPLDDPAKGRPDVSGPLAQQGAASPESVRARLRPAVGRGSAARPAIGPRHRDPSSSTAASACGSRPEEVLTRHDVGCDRREVR